MHFALSTRHSAYTHTNYILPSVEDFNIHWITVTQGCRGGPETISDLYLYTFIYTYSLSFLFSHTSFSIYRTVALTRPKHKEDFAKYHTDLREFETTMRFH